MNSPTCRFHKMLGLPGSLGAADDEDGDHEDGAGDADPAPGEDDGCDDGDDGGVECGDAGACVASGDGGDDGGDDDVGPYGWDHEDEEGESEPEEHDPEVEAPLEVAAPPEPIKTPAEKNPNLPKDIGWFCTMINS